MKIGGNRITRVAIRTEANRLASRKGRVRIIREKGTARRIGILASKP